MTIELKINGKVFADYENASVRLSMEAFAHQFSFTFSNKWLNDSKGELPFTEFDPVTISVDGVKVIDGYIDDIPIDYDASDHVIGVSGYSWTGHLVDCSAVYQSGSWRQVDMITLCKNICEPYGIDVTIEPWALPYIGGPFAKWAIEDGELAFDFIARVLKHRGLFAISNAERQLVITKANETRLSKGTIELGVNIKSGSRSSRFKDRHSYYLVKSQNAGEDDWHGTDSAGPFYSVDDPQILPFRPLIIVGDGAGKKNDLESRARWEMNTRCGRSRRVRYGLQGLRTPANEPWVLNSLMPVIDHKAGLKGEALLICSIEMNVNNSGSNTSVELCRPEAFDTMKPPKPKPKGGKGIGSLW